MDRAETDDQRCMRIAEGIDRAKQEGKGGRLIEDMIWLFDRAAGRSEAITEAVETERRACAEVARGYTCIDDEYDDGQKLNIADAIEARALDGEEK